jgi:hypothetical protein
LSHSTANNKPMLTEFMPDRLDHSYIKGVELELPEGWTGHLDVGAIGYRFTLTRVDSREITLSPEFRKQEKITSASYCSSRG